MESLNYEKYFFAVLVLIPFFTIFSKETYFHILVLSSYYKKKAYHRFNPLPTSALVYNNIVLRLSTRAY